MDARAQDGPYWVDQALQTARRIAGIHRLVVRFDEQFDRRYLLRGSDPPGSGRGYVGGIGMRVWHGNGHGYAYTNELAPTSVERALQQALRLAQAHHRHRPDAVPPPPPAAQRSVDRPRDDDGVTDAHAHEVHDQLRQARATVLAARPLARVSVAYGVKRRRTWIADDAGSWLDHGGVTSTMFLQAVERDGGRVGDASTWRGGSRTLGDYARDETARTLGAEAAERLEESLRARAAKPGRHRVLTDPNLSGLLAHESFGHLTESDLVRSGWSVLAGRLGERLAAPGVTIRDVPLAPDPADGVDVSFDAEGTAGTAVTLLDDGVLTGYLHDVDSATEAHAPATGNARALNIHHPPIVRMRNTYIAGGTLGLEEALEGLRDGYYLLGGRGGSPRADGSFMFTADRGYRVENGHIAEPVKMCSIYGNVLDFLARVEGLTNNVEMHTNYFGGCGKWDQSYLHVGTGGPDVLVSEALIGGQAA